jgi:hypothetical protein
MAGVAPDTPAAVTSRELRAAAEATKSWSCGCLHDSLGALENEFPEERFRALSLGIAAVRAQLRPVKHACLGCEVCYPAGRSRRCARPLNRCVRGRATVS